MKVCIAEKPSVAKEIAAIVGANTRREGYFEGNGYQVSWTFGHLCTLKEPHDYEPSWKSWSLYPLPMIPPRFGIKLISNEGIKKQFNVLKGLIQAADEVINCGDAGQEGELIQRWVIQLAGAQCPISRLWISSLTEDAIREGFRHLKDASEYDTLYQAGLSRAIGDWLLGMNATRLYTLRYGQNRQVLSIGRVQTPTLALIVQRQQEIEQFISHPYWELRTTYRETIFSATKGRFLEKEPCEEELKELFNHPFEVTDVTKKRGKEAPPRLFDLTSLQVEGNKKFSFSAEQTLRLIQSLYEKKVTTYPRVDTTYLTDDLYAKVPETLKALRGYESLTGSLLAAKIPKSKKVFDNSKVTDHHAIIPTPVPAANLTADEQKIYDLVVRRFIAAFYADCLIDTTTVLGKVAKLPFKAVGKQQVKPGWRVVYEKEAPQADEPTEKEETQQLLPDFVKGEQGIHTPSMVEKKTSPPKPFTEATLLRAMETAGRLVEEESLREAMKENGLGRPSTRAAIIETLFKRNYIRKEKKNLFATVTGVELIATIENKILTSAELTGAWEKKLRQIEQGLFEPRLFLDELKAMVREMVTFVRQDKSSRVIPVEKPPEKSPTKGSTKGSASKSAKGAEKPSVTLACPVCGEGTILRGRMAYGCSRYKEGCVFRLSYEESSSTLTDLELTNKLATINRKEAAADG